MKSIWFQPCIIWPLWMWMKELPLSAAFLLEAAKPRVSPVWVMWLVQRMATRSPSAMTSSMTTLMPEKALLNWR